MLTEGGTGGMRAGAFDEALQAWVKLGGCTGARLGEPGCSGRRFKQVL